MWAGGWAGKWAGQWYGVVPVVPPPPPPGPIFTSSGHDYSRQPEPRPKAPEKARLFFRAIARGEIAIAANGRAFAVADIGKRNGAAMGAILAAIGGGATASANPFGPDDEAMLLAMLEM